VVRQKNQDGSRQLYNGKLVLEIRLGSGRMLGLEEVASLLCILGCFLYLWTRGRR